MVVVVRVRDFADEIVKLGMVSVAVAVGVVVIMLDGVVVVVMVVVMLVAMIVVMLVRMVVAVVVVMLVVVILIGMVIVIMLVGVVVIIMLVGVVIVIMLVGVVVIIMLVGVVIVIMLVGVVIVIMLVGMVAVIVAVMTRAIGQNLDASRSFDDKRIRGGIFYGRQQVVFKVAAIDEDDIGVRQWRQIARAGLEAVRVRALRHQRDQLNMVSPDGGNHISQDAVRGDNLERLAICANYRGQQQRQD